MKILCIGNAAYDTVFPIAGFIKENDKIRMTKKIECGGGPASNAAYLLAKWKMDSYFAGVIGKDSYGNKILKEFNDIGVKTNFLQINKKIETNSGTVIVNTDNGSRTVLNYSPNENLIDDIEIDVVPDIILIDGHEYEFSKKVLEQFPNTVSIMTAGNLSEEKLELCKLVNYVICSKNFAEQLSNIKIDYNNVKTLISLYNRLKQEFNANIIVTLEDKGCLYELNNKIKLMPTIKNNVMDTTAASDIFGGAFTYGIANNFNLEKALKYGNIAASLSVSKLGGRTSIPTLEEVEDIYATLK